MKYVTCSGAELTSGMASRRWTSVSHGILYQVVISDPCILFLHHPLDHPWYWSDGAGTIRKGSAAEIPLSTPRRIDLDQNRTASSFKFLERTSDMPHSSLVSRTNDDVHQQFAQPLLAISYAWGEDPVFSRSLICYVKDKFSVISITPHVETMLRRFRKVLTPINLMIDALCLDQAGNRAEVQEQVQKMGELYNEVKEVKDWMGNEERDAAHTFAIFRTLQWLEQKSAKWSKSARSSWEEGGAADVLPKMTCITSSKAMRQFFHQPWFQRRWVLQELALSETATIRIGQESMSSESLFAACKMIERLKIGTRCSLGIQAQTAVRILSSLKPQEAILRAR